MNCKIVFLIFFIFLLSCKKEIENDTCTNNSKPKTELKMYKMSEMSMLMEQMYVDNKLLKQRIINSDSIGQLPNHFLKIHDAVMTDSTDYDAFFNKQASLFIESQKLIYKDPKNAKQHFNDGVTSCIKCHEVKCMGPISKIKKLYIN